MPEEDALSEKSSDDIVERLEALRKRAPEGQGEELEDELEEHPVDRRQRIARLVGVAVVVLFVLGVFFAGYTTIYKPMQQKKLDAIALDQEQKQLFIDAQGRTLEEINTAFSGLPSKYTTQKSVLLNELKRADTLQKVNTIYVAGPADSAWQNYRKDQLDEKSQVTEKLKIVVGNDTYRGYDEIKQKIEQFPYKTLQSIHIEQYSNEYFPIRLTREQAAGGWAKQGYRVNIWFKGVSSEDIDTPYLLAKNARVMAVLRGSSSGVISLTESESKTATGGGTEGKGTVPSITVGSMNEILGTFPASAGYKKTETQTAFSVDISQIQKAAAASKLPESYIEDVLGNYGVKLNSIEASTGIADFETEYIILFEVGEEEVPALVLRASPSSTDRPDIVITIANLQIPVTK